LAKDGLLAVGGDLGVERLLLAYQMGIFPWYSEGEPILWWSPDPRLVLFPDEFYCSRRLERVLRQRRFRVTFDAAFDRVIHTCASIPRRGQDGTWITPAMIAAYCRLHRLGYAHSIECWDFRGALAGGIYGISLGACFFGESMCSQVPNASKVALAYLVELMRAWGFDFLDCQVTTEHLLRMGAREVSRTEFLERLGRALTMPTRRGSWSSEGIWDIS